LSNHIVELKGGMYTLLSLRLHSSDLDAIDAGLSDKVQQAPGFFSNTPVVVDVTRIEGEESFDAEKLIERVRAHKLIPVLVNVIDSESPVARKLSLPIVETTTRNVALNDAGKEAKKSKNKQSDGEKPSLLSKSSSKSANAHHLKEPRLAPALVDGDDSLDADMDASLDTSLDTSLDASQDTSLDNTSDAANVRKQAVEFGEQLSSHMEYEPVTPRLVNRPVRSGQQLYARATDLIIMAHVGPGAEVVADNNIHVYGPLRGRALCGVSGNTESRIFCQSLEAELVSVAGNYKVLEEIPEDVRGKPAQIWYHEGRLNIEAL